ncbi:MAG: hypothetical protein WAS07_04015, partial [Micropruina sp.]
MRARTRQLWSALVVTVASAVIATIAVLYPGFAAADVELNDGGVWVTRSVNLMVGHLNYPSRVLDGALRTRTAEFDLFQDGNDVLTYDSQIGTLTQLDPATVAFLGDGSLTPGSRVAFRSGTIGLIEAANDGLYVLDPKGVPGFGVTGRDPLVELGAGSAVTVGVTGKVHAVSAARGELVTVEESAAVPAVKKLGTFRQQADLSITAVGDTPVVLDAANGVLYVEGRTVEVAAAKGGRLQSAGAAHDRVYLATVAGLLAQPLDGSEATLTPVPAGGVPAQPVFLGGCAYGIWSGTAAYVRDCAAEADDRSETLPGAGSQPTLTFRQNRNVVVVNELGEGLTWLVDAGMTRVNTWDDVVPPPDVDGEEDSPDTRTQFTLPERSPENHRPSAINDAFGVRAGSTAVLPVLDNDTDPDGDLLAAS